MNRRECRKRAKHGRIRKALRELGYIEGKNLVVEWCFAEGSFERLTALAADLVKLQVDVIVAVASAAIGAAKKATSTIPIVMATTGDPVRSGFVKSLARPGGNITGLSNMGGDTGAKLRVQSGAQNTSVKVLIAEARTAPEIETAFAVLAGENADAVIVGAAPLFAVHRPAGRAIGDEAQNAVDIRKSGVRRGRRADELRL